MNKIQEGLNRLLSLQANLQKNREDTHQEVEVKPRKS